MAEGRWTWLWTLFLCLLLQGDTIAFVLEGSPSSYARFKKWISGLNGSLSFEFQTQEPNGLLLYTDDGGAFDFFELKLVEGTLRLRFNLGGGASIISVGRNLHDGHWHRVEIIRNIEETQLRVDDDTQGRISRGPEYHFGNYTTNSFVYFGGMPSWYSSKPNLLALPSVLFEPTFKGSIKNVVYASEEGLAKEQDMIEFKGVRSNQLDACEHHDPCQHGGICISTDSGAICDCRAVDYEGSFCEREKPPSEATFRGTEFLSYDLRSTGGEAIISSSDEISLYFKTRQPLGMMFHTGHNDDFLSLSLRDGGIVLTVNLGSGSLEKTVRPAKVRFDDNQWHKVLVHRKVREITRATSFCHFSITVDGVYTERGSTAGTFSLLASSVLNIGGSSPISGPTGFKGRNNFIGCLRKVEFVADSLTLDLIELARTGNKLIVLHGNLHFLCQEVEAADPITFTTKESFLALPSWEAARAGSISFKIRTNEPNGVLMYNSGATAQGDFFAFELLDGHVFLLLNLGSGAVKAKATTRRVDDGQWHTVSLRRTGKSGRVTVDESAVDFITPGNSNQLDLEGALYLGGVGVSDQGMSVPSELWSGMLRYGYVGCMRDLVVNGKAVDIAVFAKKQDSGSIRPACHTSPTQCDSQPCLNGGHCEEGWNRFICDCSHTSFSGAVCAKDATTLSFDGGQFMKITVPEGSYTQAEDISLRFRTTRPSGLLIATTSDKTSGHLIVALESGRAKVVLNVGDGNKVVYIGQGLNDDQWHTLQITRRGQSMEARVDSESISRELTGQKITLDFHSMHIGAVVPDKSANTISTNFVKDIPNFVGHMQHFIFNGNHFFDMARNGQMTNSQVTAKFGKKDHIVHHPVTFKSKYTFIGLPQLKAYASMNLYFQFKTLEPGGLLLYNGGKGQDFLAIELVDGHLHYIFNLGDGPRRVRSNTRNTLNDNHWHAVTIGRPLLRQHTLMVDDMIATVTSAGSNIHLDLDGLLYLGGVRRSMYTSLPKLIQSKHGFEGCLASLDLNGDMLDLSKDALIPSTLVSMGCAGPVTKCSNTACANRGICVQMWNSYTCDCDMTSFTGPTCSDESIAYRFDPGGGLITFTYPKDKRPDTKSDLLALGIITMTVNAVLMRIDSGSSNDYMELEVVDGNVFMVYNMGTEDHPIGELSVNVNDGQYHVIRFTRSGPNSTIQVDDHNVRIKHPKGRQLTIFNSHSKIQVGGKKNGLKDKIERPFQGVIAGLVFNGLRILDMAAENDPSVTVVGDVELLVSLPHDSHQSSLAPTPQMQQPKGDSMLEEEDPVSSGGGSGCWDDEDRCNFNEGDDLITPVHILPTGSPTSLVTDSETNLEDKLCDDEEEFCPEGSGSGEVVNPIPTDDLVEIIDASKPLYPTDDTSEQDLSSVIRPQVPHQPSPSTVQTTRSSKIEVYGVPIPQNPGTGQEVHRPNHKSKSSADSTALVIGIIAGVLIGIVLVALIVYRIRNRSEGSYKIDESKNYQFAAVSASPSLLNGQQAHMNGTVKTGEKATRNPNITKDGKDLKEWYV
ncbi:neurexin 1-like isoform X3 [Centruroides vittatus]|uniref:neurexin 1-like isoform X3 n=1 Tax=Centruroides vittatus TaxID=120091 RepID=UPI00350F5799